MARLMLHREVLKTFGRLPAKVQKKVYELISKFEKDSTRSGIHLEPVKAARDPKVRSARVGDDYRAIVVAPQRGDIHLLMYVDHHDEAYRWAENKRFEVHGSVGTLQVFDVEQANRAVTEETPPPTATDGRVGAYPLDALSDEELFLSGVPRALIPAVRSVHGDTAFEQLAEYLPKEASQVLYGIVAGMDLDQSLKEMLGELDAGKAKPTAPGDFSHLGEIANMDLVLVEGEEHLREVLAEDLDEWRIFLHPYQRRLVEWRTRGPMKVFGSAGTGKTVVLMHRAAWLARAAQGDERILVTTYTTNLSVTIAALLERLAPKTVSRIDITNLHQLARTICYRAGWRGKIAEDGDRDAGWEQVLGQTDGQQSGFEPGFVRDEFDQIVDRMGIDTEEAYLTTVRSGRPRLGRKQRKALWKLFAAFQRGLAKRNLLTFEGVVHQARLAVEQGKFQGYRHVLVDELQDFGLESLRLIRALSPIEQGLSDPLCVVGDGHQRIYNRLPIPLGRADIEVRGRSRRLKINYRTSEQIRRWAEGLLEGVEIDDLDGNAATTIGDQSVFRGPEPQVVNCADQQAAARAVVVWVEGLIDSGLGPHEICIVPGNRAVIGALGEGGISTLELKPRRGDPGRDEPGVRYGTKKRIKGLEFRAVALLPENNGANREIERFADYVAATRAREYLLVVGLKATAGAVVE